MNCKITYTPDFARALKKLSKRYRGKSGGARVITYTVILAQADTEVKLITIYDKSERDNISDAELLEILRRNGIEV